jgi:hypothetical protein
MQQKFEQPSPLLLPLLGKKKIYSVYFESFYERPHEAQIRKYWTSFIQCVANQNKMVGKAPWQVSKTLDRVL